MFLQTIRRIDPRAARRTLIATPSMTSQIVSSGGDRNAAIPLLAAFLLGISLGVSACGEAGPPAEEDSAAVEAAAEAEEELVELDMDEYTILMDAVLPAGSVSLRLANRGFEEHNLLFVIVASDSTIWETERRLAPGERRTVTLDFEPGVYKAVCNFSGHEDRGMFTEFVVEETTPGGDGADP
jgi:hypothetical protein